MEKRIADTIAVFQITSVHAINECYTLTVQCTNLDMNSVVTSCILTASSFATTFFFKNGKLETDGKDCNN